jgi:hypothetical protein
VFVRSVLRHFPGCQQLFHLPAFIEPFYCNNSIPDSLTCTWAFD